jgi:hypothetical protein
VSSHKLEAVQSLPVVATLQQGVFDALIADPAFIPYILGFKQSVSGKQ